jgi:hypothetical protein
MWALKFRLLRLAKPKSSLRSGSRPRRRLEQKAGKNLRDKSSMPIRCSLVPRGGMTNAGDNLRVPHPLRSHRKGWDEHCSQATMPLHLPLTVFFTQAKEPSFRTEAAHALVRQRRGDIRLSAGGLSHKHLIPLYLRPHNLFFTFFAQKTHVKPRDDLTLSKESR